ncbi:hypothetical protein [Aequorivita capsosiphonis]|uniref:hypothetical protein n=1 Tax=Aequorivita capsosiphonis TaxID=487317 RepID=UPI0004233198|nr:hypothetical protein [Aequorivita capsosiphonis]
MNEKFKNVPVEDDTQIIASLEVKIDTYDVIYQKWNWDGIYAESIIFHNDDVAQLTKDQIINEVERCPGLIKEGSQITFKKLDTYTFVNFNFITS